MKQGILWVERIVVISLLVLLGAYAFGCTSDPVGQGGGRGHSDTARIEAIVGQVKDFSDAGAQITAGTPLALGFGAVSAVAAAVGAVANVFGRKSGRRQERVRLEPVISEIVGDVDAFKEEDEPFSEQTKRELIALGHVKTALTYEELGQYQKQRLNKQSA